ELPGYLDSLHLPLFVLMIAAGALGTARTARRLGRRAALIASACAYAGGLWLLAFSTNEWGLLVATALVGVGTGARMAAAPSLLADTVASHRRVAAITGYVLAIALGGVAAGVVIALGQSGLDLTWRGVILVLAALASFAVPASLLVREPGLG